MLPCEIFSVKFTEYRLAAGLCPDPLGELQRTPNPLPAIRGPTSNEREGEGRNRCHILAKRLLYHCDVPLQTVCLHRNILSLGNPPPPQFGVSFPEKQLKIVATRGEISSLKFTRYRLAAGLRPGQLGDLKRSP